MYNYSQDKISPNSVFFLAILILLVASPAFDWYLLNDSIDSQRLIEIIIISFLLLFIVVSVESKWQYCSVFALLSTTVQLAVLSCFILALLSSFFAKSIQHATLELALYVGLFYLSFYFTVFLDVILKMH